MSKQTHDNIKRVIRPIRREKTKSKDEILYQKIKEQAEKDKDDSMKKI